MHKPDETRLLHPRPGVPVLDVWHMTGLLYDVPVEQQ
jgi:hypothetical protein